MPSSKLHTMHERTLQSALAPVFVSRTFQNFTAIFPALVDFQLPDFATPVAPAESLPDRDQP